MMDPFGRAGGRIWMNQLLPFLAYQRPKDTNYYIIIF